MRGKCLSIVSGLSGIDCGINMVEDAIIDKKGRVVIPRDLRVRLSLSEGKRVRLSVDEERVIMTKRVSPDEFVREMEGCVKEGSRIPKINPLDVKRIWETA